MPVIHKKTMKSSDDADQPPSLAVAYGIKRKPKKMAKGGQVNETAAKEQRPTPSETDKDQAEVSRNSGDKAPKRGDSMKQSDTSEQAKKGRTFSLKHPKMVPSSVINARLRDQEDDLMRMADGGEINEAAPMEAAEEDMAQSPEGLETDNDQERPSDFMDEQDPSMYADGGEIEEDLQHHASLAAAIMAKREAAKMLMSDSDDDEAVLMAEGGQVDIDENNQEQPNGYYARNEDAALKENYDEDFMDDDQPTDSNEMEPKHKEEDVNDNSLVSAIRRRMTKRSPITR